MIGRILAGATYTIAILALVGWAADTPLLKGAVMGSVAMNPITALSFILAATAFGLLGRETAAAPAKRGGRLLAGLVATIGAIRLIAYALSVDFGIDKFLFRYALAGNQMAPNTAGFFLLVGVSLMFLNVTTVTGVWVTQSLLVVTAASTFLAVVGYTFGGGLLYGIPSHIPMALNTALAFLALSLGILASRPHRGVATVIASTEAGGVMARRLLPVGIVIPFLLGWLKLLGERAGLYDAEFGAALQVAFTVMIFIPVICWTARALNQSEGKRRLADRQLQEMLAFQRAILDSADYAIMATDVDGIITAFNRGAERHLGYRAEDLIGKSAPGVIHDENEVAARARELSNELGRPISAGFEAFVAKIGEGRGEEHEWTLIRQDGTRFPVLLSITAIRGAAREVAGYVGIAKDITERQAVENALRESEQRFRQLAASIDDIFWITDASGRKIIYVSPAYEKVWERSCNSLYANPADWIEGIHPGDRDRVVQAFYEKAPRGEFDEEYRVIGCQGQIRWVHACGAVVRNADGEVYRIAGVARNVTERRRYEDELKEAKRHAEEANRTKSQFLAAMSHELRTPLHGVIGMIDLLADTRLDARQHRFLEACRTSAKSLLELINDVLDLSKIESGKLVLDCHEFRPDQVVEDAARLVALRAHEKGLELVCSVDEAICRTVRGDSTRVRQILVNLLGNSVKFTPYGSVVVRASLESVNDGKAVLRFSVADTGIGIPSDRQEFLFSPFTQIDASTTRRFGGSGLGLAICKNLVEAMGGEIGLESSESTGSTFWFTVPFDDATEQRHASVIPNELRRLRVLVAAGNDLLRESLHRQLSAFGIAAETACTCEQALDRLLPVAQAAPPFDLVLADRNLSDMPGMKLASAIRANPLLTQTRVFLLMGFDDTSIDCAVCDRRLQKPICRSELLNAIVESFCPTAAILKEMGTRIAPVGVHSRSAHSGSACILLAEDNPINQMFACEVLRQAGLGCDSVSDGAKAIEAFQTERYDLILMDCHMPEMDGFEATRRIRQLEREREGDVRVPIIALTANAIQGDRSRCLEVGMDDYVTKPFEAHELIEAIDKLLATRAVSVRFVEQNVHTARNAALHRNAGVHGLPIDTAALITRCMGNVTFAMSLVDEIETTGRERVEEIARHAAAGNGTAAAEAAHSLKGAAGIIAAEPLRALAEEIELAGKAGRLEGLAERIGQLHYEMRRCVASLPEVREHAATWGAAHNP